MGDRDQHPPLSLAHLSELDVPPAALLAAAARAGFQSVGFRTHPAVADAFSYPLRSAEERAEIRSLVRQTGVSVLYVEMISLSETTRPDDHRADIETAAAIGATRLAVAGDSPDFAVVAEKMAGLADLAAPHGIAVDIEFMPFRAVKSFADAVEVVRLAGRPNAHVLLDALHVFRSGTPLATIGNADRRCLGTFQICDAPAIAPPADQLVTEARTRRLLPGDGGLALEALMAALPADLPLGVEVPLATTHPALSPADRLALLARSVRAWLNHRRTPA